MAKIGIIYGGAPDGSTIKVAALLREGFGSKSTELCSVSEALKVDKLNYDLLILGTSTWDADNLSELWRDFLRRFRGHLLMGCPVALFGLGDQIEYPDSFADGMGELYKALPSRDMLIGRWPIRGYTYYYSPAEENENFVGLVIDEDSQPKLTKERVERWVQQIKEELRLLKVTIK